MALTFRLWCTIELEHTFSNADVEPDDEGGPKDLLPTDAAVAAFRSRLESALLPVATVVHLELEAETELERHDGA